MPMLMESLAYRAFQASPLQVLRDLDVEETETTVTLRGTVHSYYQKQQALETIKPHLAGRSLHNRIEVLTIES